MYRITKKEKLELLYKFSERCFCNATNKEKRMIDAISSFILEHNVDINNLHYKYKHIAKKEIDKVFVNFYRKEYSSYNNLLKIYNYLVKKETEIRKNNEKNSISKEDKLFDIFIKNAINKDEIRKNLTSASTRYKFYRFFYNSKRLNNIELIEDIKKRGEYIFDYDEYYRQIDDKCFNKEYLEKWLRIKEFYYNYYGKKRIFFEDLLKENKIKLFYLELNKLYKIDYNNIYDKKAYEKNRDTYIEMATFISSLNVSISLKIKLEAKIPKPNLINTDDIDVNLINFEEKINRSKTLEEFFDVLLDCDKITHLNYNVFVSLASGFYRYIDYHIVSYDKFKKLTINKNRKERKQIWTSHIKKLIQNSKQLVA
jgi:hypothetical protein